MVSRNVDIFMVSETKLDETFPTPQFSLQGCCKPYWFDSNRNGDGIILYVRDHITWLLCCSNNSHKNYILIHIDFPRNELDFHSSNYDNLLLLGDLNHGNFISETQ